MSEIREEAQASALRSVVEAATARDKAQAALAVEVDALRRVAIAAAQAGAPRTRIRELARVSSKTLYTWLQEAGLDVRPQRSRRP